MENKIHRLFFFALLLLAGGCMVGPNFKPPHESVPTNWTGLADTRTNSAAASFATSSPAQLTAWWNKFDDPTLVWLVTEAFHTNLSLRLAESRLRQARASRGIVAGPLYPTLNANGLYNRWAVNSISNNYFAAGLDSVWELDIWGGTRRNIESADATIAAARESIHDTQVTLGAEIALDYIQLRAAQEQIAIAANNLKSEQRTASITRQRLAAGFVSALDVANAEAQAATTASAIPVLETTVRQNIYALSVLLDRVPGDLVEQLSQPGPVPLTPPQVPVGLPSDLLWRRPDIRVAAAQWHAATAQIGVAKSDLFPQFSLTGGINYQSDLAKTLFAGSSRLWSFGPSINWPILQGGSIAANVRLQKALTDQAAITYRQTVLGALQEVENALIAFAREWDHREALNEAVTQNRKAVDLSMQLYTQGATDFLSVLDAQRSLYVSETALSQSKASISTDLVALYKALGGGWE